MWGHLRAARDFWQDYLSQDGHGPYDHYYYAAYHRHLAHAIGWASRD